MLLIILETYKWAHLIKYKWPIEISMRIKGSRMIYILNGSIYVLFLFLYFYFNCMHFSIHFECIITFLLLLIFISIFFPYLNLLSLQFSFWIFILLLLVVFFFKLQQSNDIHSMLIFSYFPHLHKLYAYLITFGCVSIWQMFTASNLRMKFKCEN